MTDEVPNPYAERADSLRGMKPQIVADIRLYPTVAGGKALPVYPGWGCPCMVSREQPFSGYDGWPLLDCPIQPGEERQGVGFVFISEEGADVIRRAGRFDLWEGKFVGEGTVVV